MSAMGVPNRRSAGTHFTSRLAATTYGKVAEASSQFAAREQYQASHNASERAAECATSSLTQIGVNSSDSPNRKMHRLIIYRTRKLRFFVCDPRLRKSLLLLILWRDLRSFGSLARPMHVCALKPDILPREHSECSREIGCNLAAPVSTEKGSGRVL